MEKEIKKLNKILKNQKKQNKKLDIMVSAIKDRESMPIESQDKKSEENYDNNPILEEYVESLINKYIKGNSSSKIEINIINKDKIVYLNYNPPNNPTQSIPQNINNTINFVSIVLTHENCTVDSNIYNSTIKTDILSKYYDKLLEIFKEYEKEKVDNLFGELINISNLNRGNSLSILDDILNED